MRYRWRWRRGEWLHVERASIWILPWYALVSLYRGTWGNICGPSVPELGYRGWEYLPMRGYRRRIGVYTRLRW